MEYYSKDEPIKKVTTNMDHATGNNHLYSQLMNILFHPNSYFSLCISKNLNKEFLFDNPQQDVSKDVKTYFILRLIEADDTADELLKLSDLHDSISLYDAFEDYVKNIQLDSNDKAELKKSISEASKFFLSKLDQVLQDQTMLSNLNDYLQSNYSRYSNDSTSEDNTSTTTKTGKIKSPGLALTESEMLERFYREEIVSAFDIVNRYNNGALKEAKEHTFYSDWLSMAQEIKTLSMMIGQHEVEAIADRIYRLTNILRSSKTKISDDTINILKHGQRAIHSITMHGESNDDVVSTLSSFDTYILRVEKSFLDNTNSYSPNINLSNLDINNHNDISEINDNGHEESEEHQDETKTGPIDFKIPGEDDPELLVLIKEITGSHKLDNNGRDSDCTASATESDFSESNKPNDSHVDSTEFVNNEADDLENDIENDIDIKYFLEESGIYFKLTKDSIEELYRDRYSESALENLELASSCLKSQTIKFGFEEISDIPKKIESLVTYSIDKNIKLTPPILETIKEAVQLLESYNQDSIFNNRNHILHKLNHHYHDLNRMKDEHDVIYPHAY